MNKNQDKLFSGIPIIFCGINNFTPDLVLNLPEVTGVKEEADHQGTLSLAQSFFPQRTKIMIVLDDTRTSESILEEVKKVELLYAKKLSFYYSLDFEDAELEAFKEKNKETLLVYLLSYNRDKKGNFLTMMKVF